MISKRAYYAWVTDTHPRILQTSDLVDTSLICVFSYNAHGETRDNGTSWTSNASWITWPRERAEIPVSSYQSRFDFVHVDHMTRLAWQQDQTPYQFWLTETTHERLRSIRNTISVLTSFRSLHVETNCTNRHHIESFTSRTRTWPSLSGRIYVHNTDASRSTDVLQNVTVIQRVNVYGPVFVRTCIEDVVLQRKTQSKASIYILRSHTHRGMTSERVFYSIHDLQNKVSTTWDRRQNFQITVHVVSTTSIWSPCSWLSEQSSLSRSSILAILSQEKICYDDMSPNFPCPKCTKDTISSNVEKVQHNSY